MSTSLLNPHNTVSLTNLLDISANTVSRINIEDNAGEETVDNIVDLFVAFDKLSKVVDKIINIGDGHTYMINEFIGDIVDTQIPRLRSILEYLAANYRKNR